jgi:hypothetical protein
MCRATAQGRSIQPLPFVAELTKGPGHRHGHFLGLNLRGVTRKSFVERQIIIVVEKIIRYHLLRTKEYNL